MSVLPEEPAGRVADLDDGVVVLLVGDDPGTTPDEEGVIGEVEAAGRRRHGGRRVLPGDGALGVDGDEPVVTAVGDEKGAGVWRPGPPLPGRPPVGTQPQ